MLELDSQTIELNEASTELMHSENSSSIKFFNSKLSVNEQLLFTGEVILPALQAENLANTYKIAGFDLDKFLSLQAERLKVTPANSAKAVAAPLNPADQELYELNEPKVAEVQQQAKPIPKPAPTKQEALDATTQQFFKSDPKTF